MSDGPHKSLPMSRNWKRAAKFADNAATDLSDVALATIDALYTDWKREIPDSIMTQLKNACEHPDLFLDEKIDGLKRYVANRPMANFLLDSISHAIATKSSGNDAIVKGITDAIIERSTRALRQIKEHYLRKKPNSNDCNKVIDRIKEGFNTIGFENLVTRLIQGTVVKYRKQKKTGLDDGVNL